MIFRSFMDLCFAMRVCFNMCWSCGYCFCSGCHVFGRFRFAIVKNQSMGVWSFLLILFSWIRFLFIRLALLTLVNVCYDVCCVGMFCFLCHLSVCVFRCCFILIFCWLYFGMFFHIWTIIRLFCNIFDICLIRFRFVPERPFVFDIE